MRQISIDTKFHHHSDKDVTISRGANKCINITFRNDSWELITTTDYIGFYATKDGRLTITDGQNPKSAFVRKLGRGGGNKSTHTPHSRYVCLSEKVDADVRNAIEKTLRDKETVSFDLFQLVPDERKDAITNDFHFKAVENKEPTPIAKDITREQFEAFKDFVRAFRRLQDLLGGL